MELKSLDGAKKFLKEKIFNVIRGDYWIAGGALRNYFLTGDNDSDYDLFFNREIDLIEVDTFCHNCLRFLDSTPYAILYNIPDTHIKIHLIRKRYYESMEDVISDFDFTVCCGIMDKGGNFICHERYFDHLQKMVLYFNTPINKATVLQRAFKYYSYGFKFASSKQINTIQHLLINDVIPENINETSWYGRSGTPTSSTIAEGAQESLFNMASTPAPNNIFLDTSVSPFGASTTVDRPVINMRRIDF